MIQNEVNCLSQLPLGWQWLKLEELVIDPKHDIVDGPFGSDFKASEYIDHGIPIIRLQNIDRNLFIDKNIKFISKEKAEQLKRHVFSAGDIIITKLGAPLGKACFVPEKMQWGIIVADIVRIRVNHKLLSCKYLVYSINSQVVISQLERLIKGTTRPRVNLNHIRALYIPFSPLSEQHRIVDKIEELFTKLDAGVDALKKIQVQLKRYRQSVLKSAFEGKLTEEWRKQKNNQHESAHILLQRIRDKRPEKSFKTAPAQLTRESFLPKSWTWAPLGILSDIISGYAFQGKDFNKEDSNVVPVIKIGNIGYGSFMHQSQDYLPQIYATEYNKFLVSPNTVLLALTRPITNDELKVCLYPSDAKPALLNQRVAMINPISLIDKKYIFLFMRSVVFKKDVMLGMSQTLQPNLSPLALNSFNVPIAPLSEQRKIVEEIEYRLSVIDEIETVIEQGIKQSERLRQSILKDAYEGKLVPQNPNDEPAEKLLERIRAERAAQSESITRQRSSKQKESK